MSSSTWPARLRPALTLLRAQWEASCFPGLVAWWADKLCACLPRSMQARLAREDPQRLLQWREGQWWMDGVALSDPAPARAHPAFTAASFAQPADTRRVLLLGPGQALVCDLVLPAGAARDLASVLSFEMDRHTPFKAGEVYHASRRRADAPGPSIALSLAVARRDRVDDLLAALDRLALRPDAIDVQAADGTRLGVDLMPAGRARRRPGSPRRTNLVLMLVALAMAAAAMQLWVHNRGLARDELRRQLAGMRTEAREIDLLRKQLQERLGAMRYLAQRRQAMPAAAASLDAVTRCLPADTWLNELTIDGSGRVGMTGQSRHAGALVEAMKPCAGLTGLRFQGAIQPDKASGQERFYLLADLRRQEAADAPRPEAP